MKEIILNNGKKVAVDDSDYEELNKFNWRYIRGYAIAQIPMHRLILRPQKGLDVDHINRDRLNNTKGNLRVCSRVENSRNIGVNSANSSGYKGVCFLKRYGKWRARIRVGGGKRLFLGYFNTAKEASVAYEAKAKELFGEFYYKK